MTRHCFSLTAGGRELKLRLTMAGQRALRERYGEDALTFLLSCLADNERLCELLTQCLTWSGQENAVTDGGELYDLLVDEGWRGQEKFSALVFDLGVASGLLTDDQAEKLKQTVAQTCQTAYDELGTP